MEHEVQHAEMQQLLDWHKEAMKALESPNADTEKASLIRAPDHSTKALMAQGFTRMQAKSLENKIEAQKDPKNFKLSIKYQNATKDQRKRMCWDAQRENLLNNPTKASAATTPKDPAIPLAWKIEVEEMMKKGARPEHAPMIKALRQYNGELVKNILKWEKEGLLREFLDAIWDRPDFEEISTGTTLVQ